QPFATLDRTETHMFAVDSQGNGQLFASSGGAATQVDSNVSTGFIAPHGSIVYLTSLNELKRWNGGATSLETLMPTGGFAIFDELSPDGKTALLTMNLGLGQTFGEDLWSASALSTSSPHALLQTPTGAPGSLVNGEASSF